MSESIGAVLLIVLIMMFGAFVYQVWLDRDIWKNNNIVSEEELESKVDNYINGQNWK